MFNICSYIEISTSLFWCKFHRIHILWASTICTNFPLLWYCLNLKCTASELLSFYRRHPSFWSFKALIFSSLITHSAWINKLIKQEKVLLFEVFAERMNQIHCHIIELYIISTCSNYTQIVHVQIVSLVFYTTLN